MRKYRFSLAVFFHHLVFHGLSDANSRREWVGLQLHLALLDKISLRPLLFKHLGRLWLILKDFVLVWALWHIHIILIVRPLPSAVEVLDLVEVVNVVLLVVFLVVPILFPKAPFVIAVGHILHLIVEFFRILHH